MGGHRHWIRLLWEIRKRDQPDELVSYGSSGKPGYLEGRRMSGQKNPRGGFADSSALVT